MISDVSPSLFESPNKKHPNSFNQPRWFLQEFGQVLLLVTFILGILPENESK